MEKFLQKHELSDDGQNAQECYLIEVFNECDELVDMIHAYCFLDLIRIQDYYIGSFERFWVTVKVIKC